MNDLNERIGALARGRRIAVLGVGHRMRGDDGAGSRVAERLAGRCNTVVFDGRTVPENFLGPLLAAAPEVVLIVDAADHGAPPGACCLVPVTALAHRGSSTHSMSLSLLARILESRGIECWLVGIQPGQTAWGAPMTPAVESGAQALEDALAEALKREEACHA